MAIAYLEDRGYTLIKRNIYLSHNEIDLIMTKNGDLYLIEVKYRQSQAYGYPIEAMTPTKCKHFRRACQAYLRNENNFHRVHMSFLGILKTEEGYDYNWVKDFFT